MRNLVVAAIGEYQSRISPYKGYSCAYRALTGRTSCSQFVKLSVARVGVLRSLALLSARFRACASAAAALSEQDRTLSSTTAFLLVSLARCSLAAAVMLLRTAVRCRVATQRKRARLLVVLRPSHGGKGARRGSGA